MTAQHRPRRILGAAVAALLASGVAASSAVAQGASADQPGAVAQQQAQAPSGGPKTALPPPTPRAAQPNQSRAIPITDWPCIQPKVPQLSYGQVWSGPPLDESFDKWRDDDEVSDLAEILVARRTTKEEAAAALDRFVKAAGPDKNARLTLLFAAIFQEINASRSAVINGIERYARKQRVLSERIKQASLKMASERKDMATQNSPEFQKKQEGLDWETRIYDERAHALTYVCESPVILDQLAFERGRDIQGLMN